MTQLPLWLTGRTILITGGGSGIGRGLAEALHAAGNHVIIAGRREAALNDVVAVNSGMTAMPLDVADPEAVSYAARHLLTEYPVLDTIIHAAGVGYVDDLGGSIDDDELTATFDINVLGPVRLSAALLGHLRKQPDAAIIYVTSMLAYLPYAETALYSASKAALHAIVLAQRYRLRDTNVRIIEIAPPLVATQFAGNYRDPRAMPLASFIAETMRALKEPSDEVLIPTARARRDSLRTGELEAVTAFNDRMGAT
jgi:uncharacterized oxidoreductase